MYAPLLALLCVLWPAAVVVVTLASRAEQRARERQQRRQQWRNERSDPP